MSTLTVYKASAGSGKTYRLVLEYIKLVLKNPFQYRHVLAVTFTNKATTEMKERILSDLYQVATSGKDELVKLLVSETGMAENKIRQNARIVLSNILHDFDRFSVSTIDSFFQKILKGFIREIGLNGLYDIELDQEQMISEACDRVLNMVDQDKDTEKWLIEMSEFQLSGGKTWLLNNAIETLAKEITNEKFLEFALHHTDEMYSKEKLKLFKSEVNRYIQWFKSECIQYGKKGLELIRHSGLEINNFKGGSNTFANYFNYLAQFREDKIEPNQTTLKACNTLDNWKTKDKKDLHQAIDTVYHGGLNELLCKVVDFVDHQLLRYHTAVLILKNLHAFGIISALMAEIRKIGKENNSMLLSESDQLIKTIVADNDAPFIYEKTGNYYQHFMIDEFQDTSATQWHNFKPLITNSLSENNANLIVGDVKQSIYRWRNGDWRLLGKQLNDEMSKFKPDQVPLVQNWRSSPEVVEFNNFLFSKAPTLIQDYYNLLRNPLGDNQAIPDHTIADLYTDVVQENKITQREGEVRVTFIGDSENKNGYREQSIELMIKDIERLQRVGYRAGSMSVLIRNNKDGVLIAKALANKKRNDPVPGVNYELVSEDSLYLANSLVVKFIITMFNLILQPANKVWSSSAVFIFEHQLLPKLAEKGMVPEELRIELKQENEPVNHFGQSDFFSNSVVNSFFPFLIRSSGPSFLKKWANLNPSLLLAEIESVYNLGEIREEQANLQSFRDLLGDYLLRETPILYRFVEWWEKKGYKSRLQFQVNHDAISILTIHKSKGLEFPIVFIPFCDWAMNPESRKNIILWCETMGTGFEQLPLIPVNFGEKLAKSSFSSEYYSELMMSYIDNLNLMYVAFTRAIDGLYININGTPNQNSVSPGKKTGPKAGITVSKLMEEVFSLYGSQGNLVEYSKNCYGLGTIGKPKEKQKEKAINIDLSGYRSRGNLVFEHLHVKTNHVEFWDRDGKTNKDKLGYGKLIHEILSNLVTKDDLDYAIGKIMIDGKAETLEIQKIKQEIEQILKHPMVESWFDGSYRVLNERDIIVPGDGVYRPDRIMENSGQVLVVDYKTSRNVNPEHRIQVEHYTQLLGKMGKINVKGFIWYLTIGKIVDVSDIDFWEAR